MSRSSRRARPGGATGPLRRPGWFDSTSPPPRACDGEAEGWSFANLRVVDAAEEALAIARVRSWLRTGRARAVRERARLSQADVGAAIGTDGPQVSRWECGKATPRSDSALKLARLLGELDAMIGSEEG